MNSPSSPIEERRWTLIGRVMGPPGNETPTVEVLTGMDGPLLPPHQKVEVMPVEEHEAQSKEVWSAIEEALSAFAEGRDVLGEEALVTRLRVAQSMCLTSTQPNPIGDPDQLQELLKAVADHRNAYVDIARPNSWDLALYEVVDRIRDEQKGGQ